MRGDQRHTIEKEEPLPKEAYLQKPPTGKLLLRTLIAAVAAAVVNNVYSLVYTAITGFSIPEVINPVSVTLFSLVPVILFVALSIPSFGETIQTPTTEMPAPEGFADLSFGLHFAGPIFLPALVPQWRPKTD